MMKWVGSAYCPMSPAHLIYLCQWAPHMVQLLSYPQSMGEHSIFQGGVGPGSLSGLTQGSANLHSWSRSGPEEHMPIRPCICFFWRTSAVVPEIACARASADPEVRQKLHLHMRTSYFWRLARSALKMTLAHVHKLFPAPRPSGDGQRRGAGPVRAGGGGGRRGPDNWPAGLSLVTPGLTEV